MNSSVARLRAALEASVDCDLVCIWDGFVRWAPDHLERMLEIINKESGIACASPQYKIVPSGLSEQAESRIPDIRLVWPGATRIGRPGFELVDAMLWNWLGSGFMVRRSVLASCEFVDLPHQCVNWSLLLQILAAGQGSVEVAGGPSVFHPSHFAQSPRRQEQLSEGVAAMHRMQHIPDRYRSLWLASKVCHLGSVALNSAEWAAMQWRSPSHSELRSISEGVDWNSVCSSYGVSAGALAASVRRDSVVVGTHAAVLWLEFPPGGWLELTLAQHPWEQKVVSFRHIPDRLLSGSRETNAVKYLQRTMGEV